METRRKKHTHRQKNLFTMTSGGFVIVVRNITVKKNDLMPNIYINI